MSTERTPAGLQHVLPGCPRDWHGRTLQLAHAPLKPAKPQSACDFGLFSDQCAQVDLIDLANKGK